MTITIQDAPIDIRRMIDDTRNSDAGALVTFQGTVRRFSGDLEVESLTYEAYREMALKSIEEIVDRAKEMYGVIEINVIHRVGTVKLTEDSVAICVSAAHRAEGFKACEYVIDEIKKFTPIWKKDNTPAGRSRWRD